jgi:hypothetical protein
LSPKALVEPGVAFPPVEVERLHEGVVAVGHVRGIAAWEFAVVHVLARSDHKVVQIVDWYVVHGTQVPFLDACVGLFGYT